MSIKQFNLLKDAYCVKNTELCRYDSLNGYTTEFNTNGDVDGWDIYSGICMYGVWNAVLFGTSTANSCFIGRTDPFTSVTADLYYVLKINMKLTLPSNYGKKTPPTVGKLMWLTASDNIWDDKKSIDFDISLTDQWHTYIIHLGEAKYWLGEVNNLRVYPFLDGFEDIRFMIKSIVIDSVSEYTCLNTQCSYYLNFSHPCLGIGKRSAITSGISQTIYTTVSGVSDTLILNIDGYGDEYIKLGNAENLSGAEMAKVMSDRISRINFGTYTYAEVIYQEEAGTLSIFSGAMSAGSVMIVSGTAAKALGFLDQDGNAVYTFESGEDSATGFDFGTSRRLKAFELNALVDSSTEKVAYYHNPTQYSVEAGRSDFADSMSSNGRPVGDKIDYYDYLEASQKLIIDASHPINDSGRINKLWVNGSFMCGYDKTAAYSAPKVYILRPDKFNNVEVIHELIVPVEDNDTRYTKDQITFVLDCDISVNKGDLVGFFNMMILAPFSSRNKKVNGVYFEVACGTSGPSSGKFCMGQPMSQGVIGLSFYARSNRLQENIQLDIDMGERINIEEISIYGKEFTDVFEYNIGCCLDMDWQVDLYNDTHWHTATTGHITVSVEHRNKAYGIDCLSDCVNTTDGGQAGTSYVTNSLGPTVTTTSISDPDLYSGIETYGTHTYFYVNGDAEWLNSGGCLNEACDNREMLQAEFSYPWVADIYDFEYDPISFYLIFPNEKWFDVHKSAIYFKETQNFLRYSLSYYLGASGEQGNAEEVHFNYVPAYNTVTMDGLAISAEASDSDPLVQVYSKTIFQNPVPWAIPEYQNGVCTNFDIYLTLLNLDYNVLQHEFDTISCRGFKIHTTWHKSTKITEMELYSTIPVEPTLLDNIRIQTSTYGDIWSELSFVNDENDDEKINAYVSSSPRYFRLQLQSQSTFELKEATASLSNVHFKALQCENTILQTNAPKYQLTEAKLVEIENSYDIPLDLSIGIPRQLFKENYILSWIRFDSDDTTFNGEVGPGAIVRKTADYQLYLAQGQIAINTPAYYLENLINGKNSYIYENEHEWSFYKQLVHGEDVDYTNTLIGKVTNIGFLPVSSRFWKLCVHETGSIDIKNMKLFFNSESSVTPVAPSTDFSEYSDGTYLDYDLWSQQDVPVMNNRLEMEFLGDGKDHCGVVSSFFVEGDFDIRLTATIHSFSGYGVYGPQFSFLSATDTSTSVIMRWCNNVSSYNRQYNIATTYQGSVSESRTSSSYNWTAGVTESFKLTRSGNLFTFYRLSGASYVSLGEYTFNAMSSKVYFSMSILNTIPYASKAKIFFNDFTIYSGYTFLGDLTSTFLVVNPVDIHKVHIQARPNKYSDKFETTFNYETHTINPAILVEDNFSDGVWEDVWSVHTGVNNSGFVEKNNAIYPFISAGDLIYFEKSFLPGTVSYEAEIHFHLDFPTTLGYFIEFINPDDEVSFKLSLIGDGADGAFLRIESTLPKYIYVQQEGHDNVVPYRYIIESFTKDISTYTDGFKFTCSKSYQTFDYLKLTNTSESCVFYSGSSLAASFDRISKIRISYYNTSSLDIHDQLKNYGTTYIKFSALPKLSELEAVVFEFANSQPIDTIKLVQSTSSINYPSLWLSTNDTDDYYLWAKNFNTSGVLSVSNQSFFGDSCYSLSNMPYYCLDGSSNTLTYIAADHQHFLIYDFGSGNGKNIRYIYYKSYYYKAPSVYGEKAFKTCRIYGADSYNTYFVKYATSIDRVRVDLSNAVLLTEFTINHSDDYTAYNDIYLADHADYRYLIFHYPYNETNSSSNLWLSQLKLYELYEQTPSSYIMLSNSEYINYLTIDLGGIYKLDFLRNYGSKSNLIDFNDPDIVDFSNTDTNDINNVEWVNNRPVLLFNFLDYLDVVNPDRSIYTSGTLTLYTSGGPLSDHGHIGISISNAGGGSLSLDHSSDFILSDQDFTIDFWFKRIITGQEGILGQISDKNISSAFSFTFSIYDHLIFTAYSSTSLFELSSLASVVDMQWHHIAVCRHSTSLSMYLDGKIQGSKDIADAVINECASRFKIGQVDLDMFRGYLDEFRLLIGTAAWISNFDVPTEAYVVSDQKGTKDSARWLRFALLCGDNVSRNINKIGVYPDITVPYRLGGGYNCSWVPIYDRLSNYSSLSQNIAPRATVVGQDTITLTFEDETSLIYFEDLTSTIENTHIFSTDFGDAAPHTFWSSVSDTLVDEASYYSYQTYCLRIYLSAVETGSLIFRTFEVYEDCACDIHFSDLAKSYYNGLGCSLNMYAEDGTVYTIKYFCSSSTVEYYSIYKDSSLATTTPVDSYGKVKIERELDVVRFYKFVNSSWSLIYTFTSQTELAGGGVYFSFILYRATTCPDVDFTLYSLSVNKLVATTSEEVFWGLVPTTYGSYGLGCNTNTAYILNGPTLRHPFLSNGSQIQYAEFYYYNEGQGGGISFMDSSYTEVLGIAIMSSAWLIFSASGWEVVNYNPSSGNSSWYRVKAVFDWYNSTVVIEWEDVAAGYITTFTKLLVTNSNVELLQIKGTFGACWGANLLNIKFDNISISPSLTYLSTFKPSNCILGDLEAQGYNNCWGFPASIDEPTLILDLGAMCRVNKFVIYSRPSDDNYDYIVNDFEIYAAATLSGTFDLLVSESGFTESLNVAGNNVYELENSVYLQYVKLVIKAYTKPDTPLSIYMETRDGGSYVTLDGGFIREFQIWQTASSESVNSEDHPVICMDLKGQFNLTSHKMECILFMDGDYKSWSNADEFFQLSSDITDDPHKVAFFNVDSSSSPFSYTDSFTQEYSKTAVYVLESDIFLPLGHYQIQWDIYNAIGDGAIQLLIVGVDSKTLYSTYISNSWVTQLNEFNLNISDYYTIQVRGTFETYIGTWGVRNVYFKSFDYTTKWLAVRRNTATNFVWDTNEYNSEIDNTPGIDYLKRLKLYADGQHRPTEYWWMWEAALSSLENECVNVKVGKSALKINYPATNAVDYVRFLEGDHFGNDCEFSIKDSLCFWFYIEDLNRLFIDEGGFIFGSVDGYSVDDYQSVDGDISSANPAYYIWKFKDLSLVTGWNYVRLHFDQYYLTSPVPGTNKKLSSYLDFKDYVTSSFRMVFQGNGEAFYMLLDGLKIERNWYYDEVMYGDHGLCLTGSEFAEIPLSGLDTRYGTIEVSVKLYTNTAGIDHFNKHASRTLFTLVDSSNISISLSIRSGSWFEIGVGDTKKAYVSVFIDPEEVALGIASRAIDDIVHIALVWDNTASFMSNDTLRLYIDGNLYLSSQVTWATGDNKNVILRLGGGNTYLANSDDASGSAIFSNVKLYNYCKTVFEVNQQIPSDVDSITPNDFVQISVDDIVYYSSKDTHLPITYDLVPPGVKIPIYIKVDKSKIDTLDSLTGSIGVEWKIPV